MMAADRIPPRGGERFDDMTENNRCVFDWSMSSLDQHMQWPLFGKNAKQSTWYSVGLLARGRPEDINTALQLLENTLTQQYLEEGLRTYGTFKSDFTTPWASKDSLAPPKIYDTYDPNNALFVTLGFIVIDAKLHDLIPTPLLTRMRQAMYTAVKGDEGRVAGVDDENLRPCYTNPWYMRIVCSAYVGALMDDSAMVARSESYLKETMQLFEQHKTTSEYNSPTYIGITLMALGVASYLSPTSPVRVAAAQLVSEIWREIGMIYNATLVNLSGPWDRTYGYDMKQYVTPLGAAIANIVGVNEQMPLPNPLSSSLHFDDAVAVPIMSLLAPQLESQLSTSTQKAFFELAEPHFHISHAFSPPFDKHSRQYSFYVGNGYSVGGVEFDQQFVGGASINPIQFAPGVILWDSGIVGNNIGWISVYPTASSCSIIASEHSLTIQCPPSTDFADGPPCRSIRLHMGTFPDLHLASDSFSMSSSRSPIHLPGMDIRMSGNVAKNVAPDLSYASDDMHGWRYYILEYKLPESMAAGGEVPELVIGLERQDILPAVGRGMAAIQPTSRPSEAQKAAQLTPINNLADLPRTNLTVDYADRLICLMRERLVNLKDDSGEFLYKFEDGSVVDTKGWLGWDWTQGVALAALFHHAEATSSSSAATRSLEVIGDWFSCQYKMTRGKGVQKNINTVCAIYALGSMIHKNCLAPSSAAKCVPWLEEWMQWVADDQSGLPRTKEGGFQHVTYEHANTDQLWDDTLFMTCVPLARASIVLKRPEYLQLAISEVFLHAHYLCDARSGLWYHGWQFETGHKLANGHNFADARWARGNCWVTIAIPMLLDTMGSSEFSGSSAVKTNLVQIWRRQVNALLKVQNTNNGMWHTLLDDPCSYIETSATAGFVAGMFMGLRLGIVESSIKDHLAKAAFDGLRAVIAQISPDGEVNNVSFGTPMGHSLQFYREIPLTSMPYGQALAMLALVEWIRWAS